MTVDGPAGLFREPMLRRRRRAARVATWPRVAVVIPAKNEAKNLPYVFDRMPPVHEVVLVDGASTDDTVDVARALWPSVIVIHQNGRGKGHALQQGFSACTADIIVMLDADGSADPAEIPLFVEALSAGADFAKGSRVAPGGGSADITALRHAGNQMLTTLVNVLYATRYSDLCYGYNAFWRRCLPAIDVDVPGFEVETLMNIRVAKARLRVAEVASFEGRRIFGTSNLRTFRDGWRVLRTIVRERAPSPAPGPASPPRLVHATPPAFRARSRRPRVVGLLVGVSGD